MRVEGALHSLSIIDGHVHFGHFSSDSCQESSLTFNFYQLFFSLCRQSAFCMSTTSL